MTEPALLTVLPPFYGEDAVRPGDPLRVRWEEEAIVWLWAKPSLLSWSQPVEWLFSPVVGKARWPGDLWGIDSNGELLVIEAKRFKGGKFFDPFTDFVEYCKQKQSETEATNLCERWERKYRAELRAGSRLNDRGKHKEGVMPNSCDNRCLRRWPELTAEAEHRIRSQSSGYAEHVRSYLDLRKERGDPTPHYCGLLVADRQREGVPVPRASMQEVASAVGTDHVHLFVASAQVAEDSRVRFSVQRVERT